MNSGHRDRFDLALTTASAEAAAHYVEALDLLLEQSFGSEAGFEDAIAADEGFALPHASLAYLRMGIADGSDRVAANRARELSRNATARERDHVEAIWLFIHGHGTRARTAMHAHLDRYPRDVMILRAVNRLYTLGCSGAGVKDFPSVYFPLLKSLAPSYGDDWAFLSHYAFGHHEVGLFDEALALAERSLAQRPTSGHAAHSIAHAHFEQGNARPGSDFLGGWLQSYDRRSPFNVHLSWHQALFELALGRYDEAVELYREAIYPTVEQRDPGTLADSASLMWRMRLYGRAEPALDTGLIREQAGVAVDTSGPAFRDAHAALAFAATGDTASSKRMRQRLHRQAEAGEALHRDMTLPLVDGITNFAAGDYAAAIACLEPVMPQLVRIGGSHAQREVFEDTWVEALVRDRQLPRAMAALEERLVRRPSVRDRFWLARVKAEAGDPSSAHALLQEVAQNWQQADPDSPEADALHDLISAVAFA